MDRTFCASATFHFPEFVFECQGGCFQEYVLYCFLLLRGRLCL